MAKKPVLLCIMDGFGWVPEQTFGNAIAAARRPNLDRLFETYPYTTIQASGMAVGLPEGQMGNSEVGHTNMGAGRIVYQQLTLITKSIMDGTMKENDVLVRNMRAAIDAGKAVHLMGLLGTVMTDGVDGVPRWTVWSKEMAANPRIAARSISVPVVSASGHRRSHAPRASTTTPCSPIACASAVARGCLRATKAPRAGAAPSAQMPCPASRSSATSAGYSAAG